MKYPSVFLLITKIVYVGNLTSILLAATTDPCLAAAGRLTSKERRLGASHAVEFAVDAERIDVGIVEYSCWIVEIDVDVTTRFRSKRSEVDKK